MSDKTMNPAPSKGTRYKFPVPKSVGILQKPQITVVHLRLLTGTQELLAAKKSRGNTELGGQFKLAHELVKMSLVAVNGEDVSTTDGSVDKAWDGMHPQMRQLVLQAYAKLHNVDDEVAEDFLGGMTIET